MKQQLMLRATKDRSSICTVTLARLNDGEKICTVRYRAGTLIESHVEGEMTPQKRNLRNLLLAYGVLKFGSVVNTIRLSPPEDPVEVLEFDCPSHVLYDCTINQPQLKVAVNYIGDHAVPMSGVMSLAVMPALIRNAYLQTLEIELFEVV